MRRVVLHASAFADWIAPARPQPLRTEFEAGQLGVIIPATFVVDTLGELASRGWSAGRLERAAKYVGAVGFRVMEPPASEVAHWLARRVPPSAASYAALASWLDIPIAVADPALRDSLRTIPVAE